MPSFVRGFNVLSRCVALWRSRRLADADLKGCHHSYVYAVCHHPGLSQDELAARLFINKSNVARHLAYLEERGLVRREPDAEDRRAMRVYPTEKMQELFPRMKEATEEFKCAVSRGISEEEMNVFLRVLEQMALNAAEAVREGEAQ